MMILLSKLCGIVIFMYCVCRLSARVHDYKNLSFYAHVFLIPSAVAIVIAQTPPTIESLVFRLGVALYFASQTLKIWRLQQRLHKMRPVALPKPEPRNHLKRCK